MRRLIRFIRRRGWLLLAVALLAGGLAHLEAVSRFDRAALAPESGPLILDRRGQVLRLVPDARGRKLVKLPPEPIPPAVAAAFVAAEDQRFWRHPGVDPLAIVRAFWSNLRAGRITSGASTITQQLARLTYPGPRTYGRKVVEISRSLRIEQALSKPEILRHYLDRVPLGNNLVGVETAALAYFGKKSAQLSASEAALIASLAKAPGVLNPCRSPQGRLWARQDWVLGRMKRLGLINGQELGDSQEVRGVARRPPFFAFEAPHFVNFLQGENRGPVPASGLLKTTLDLGLQRRAEAIVASHRAQLLKSGASQAAAVILDNKTLGVLALVGSCKYGPRDRGFNNGATAWRSPGSALKPFLYAQALDAGFTSASILEDVEQRYQTPRGEFFPVNFNRFAYGPVSFREALANSLNLSSVALLHQIEPRAYYDTLTKLKLINYPEQGPDHYGLGLVVGNPEVSLLQLAGAYACLANGGLFRPPRLRLDDPEVPGVEVFSPQAAYIINDILSDPMARGRIFGASMAMNPPYRLAIKTGTSSRYRDCWAVGYTPERTLAVWVGNFSGQPTAKLSGAAAAAPILSDLAAAIFKPGPPQTFPKPEGVVAATVCAFSGLSPGLGCAHVRQELFMAGTEPDPNTLCTFHPAPEPWHRMPTNFAGWLHQRFTKKGEGRYRLADFDLDLHKTFLDPVETAIRGVPNPAATSGRLTLGTHPAGPHGRASPAATSGRTPPLAIVYPLNGNRYLLEPRAEAIRLTVKAKSLLPIKTVAYFLNAREVGAVGPPYEITLDLPRGRHRLTVVGPDLVGDCVEVFVQ